MLHKWRDNGLKKWYDNDCREAIKKKIVARQTVIAIIIQR